MPTMLHSDLAARTAATCRAALGLRPRDRVLVAVSGGADSGALASLLAAGRAHDLRLDLVLCHVDHGWRGAEEAGADREVVERLAASLRLPLALAGPPPTDTPRTEDAARRHRYSALARLAEAHRCTYVATGHHAGDQAETFLLRLLRGSGLRGLTGIPARRSLAPGLTVVRPLLEIEPPALRRYLLEHGLPWRDDPTNQDLSIARNAVRARLARREARGHASTLVALAARLRRRLRQRARRIQSVAASRFVHHERAGAVSMPRAALATLHGEDLALALRAAGAHLRAEDAGPWFVRRHVALLEKLLVTDGDLDLPRGLFLHVAGKTAWLARRRSPLPPRPALLRQDVAREYFDLDAWIVHSAPDRVALDADVLGPGATLHPLSADDAFTPFGSRAGGRKPVADWLARSGMPGFVRRAQLVVRGQEGVAWVVGLRPDAGHVIGPSTQTVALLSLENL